MPRYQLLDDVDVRKAFAAHLRGLRRKQGLSRAALADRSGVPSATIKRFELSTEISFRQLLLLWQCLDDLKRFMQLTKEPPRLPLSIDEVLKDEL